MKYGGTNFDMSDDVASYWERIMITSNRTCLDVRLDLGFDSLKMLDDGAIQRLGQAHMFVRDSMRLVTDVLKYVLKKYKMVKSISTYNERIFSYLNPSFL